MCRRVCTATISGWFSAFDTVPTDTPARSATSRIVTLLITRTLAAGPKTRRCRRGSGAAPSRGPVLRRRCDGGPRGEATVDGERHHMVLAPLGERVGRW